MLKLFERMGEWLDNAMNPAALHAKTNEKIARMRFAEDVRTKTVQEILYPGGVTIRAGDHVRTAGGDVQVAPALCRCCGQPIRIGK